MPNIIFSLCLILAFLLTEAESGATASKRDRRKGISRNLGELGAFPSASLADHVFYRLPVDDGDDRHSFYAKNWEGLLKMCEEESFNLELYVDHHIYLLALPKDKKNGCPSVAFHDGGDHGKELAVLQPDLSAFYSGTEEVTLSLRKGLELGEIHSAFEKSKTPFDPRKYDEDYDIVMKNCATFILDMMSHLDIPADQSVVDYTVDGLVKSGFAAEMVRQSPHVDRLLQRSGLPDAPATRVRSKNKAAGLSDQDIVTSLVERYIEVTRQQRLEQDEENAKQNPGEMWFLQQLVKTHPGLFKILDEHTSLNTNGRRALGKKKDKMTSKSRQVKSATSSRSGKSTKSFKSSKSKSTDKSRGNKKSGKKSAERGTSESERSNKSGEVSKGERSGTSRSESANPYKGDGVTEKCELDVPPLGGFYFFDAEFTTRGEGFTEFEILCDGSPPFEDGWEFELISGDARPANISNGETPGLTFGYAGSHEIAQSLECPEDSKLEIKIVGGDLVEKIVIKRANCVGSLIGVEVYSPSGNLYTTDLDLENGDERFLWDFGSSSEIGSYFVAGCLDLVCPITLPRDRLEEVYVDPIDLEAAFEAYDDLGLK